LRNLSSMRTHDRAQPTGFAVPTLSHRLSLTNAGLIVPAPYPITEDSVLSNTPLRVGAHKYSLLRGTSKRLKKPQILTPEQSQELVSMLRESCRTMVIVAICTGLRVSVVLALCWQHIDFKAGVMLVQQGVANGRVGKVKPKLPMITPP
jgi:integrase